MNDSGRLYRRAYRRGVLVYVVTPEPGDVLVPHSTPIHVPSRKKSPMIVLAMVVLALLLPGTAHADHANRKWATGATINFQNRSGLADTAEVVRIAVDHYNAMDANFTVVYSEGPADGCFSFEANLVKWCVSGDHGGANTSIYPSSGTIDRANVVIGEQASGAIFAGTHEGGHVLGMNHSCEVSVMYMRGLAPGPSHCSSDPNYSKQRPYPTDHDREVLVATYGAKARPAVTVAGSTWFSDGTMAATARREGEVSARASGAVPGVPYQLVAGKGTTTQPCRYNRVPLNRTHVYASPNGLIGTVTGTAHLNPGTYQVCFAQPDPVSGNRAVSQAGTLTVT